MSKPEQHSWWSTLPGLITAVGGILTAAAGLIVALHSVGWLASTNDSAQPVAKTPNSREGANTNPAPVVDGPGLLSANILYREFQTNPVDASNKYVGKALVLEGIVSNILLRSDGVGAVVHISDRGNSKALILSFPRRNDLAGISLGQKLRFRCTLEKYEYSIVWMEEDCEIQN
jgi:hypothetical protein